MSYLLWQPVREMAARHPDRLAIVDARGETRYAELLDAADRVSTLLRDRGVAPGDRVGVLATKSSRCIASMIGAVQAGACYVPVDPRAPAARSGLILSNAGIRFLVSESSLLTNLGMQPGAGGIPDADRILLLDDGDGSDPRGTRWHDLPKRPSAFTPALRNELDPAYILYTSGSTGVPKGVVISHRNALTFVDWGRETFALGPEDRLSNHAPFHFDLSVFDIYGALSSGGSVHLVPDRIAAFPRELAKWIADSGITVWYSVPSALIRLLLGGELTRFTFDRLRAILFAGEVFPIKHLRAVMEAFPHTAFHNLYGPTETNVCTHYPVPRPLPEEVEDLPIGDACPNMEVFAITEGGKKCALGEEGELVVRGPCVMLGYWGLPDRTRQSITPNPLHADYIDPIYHTGDLVRVVSEGGFRFLGRRDHMVKVRGYRVELGEIEQALLSHQAVREAAVVAVKDDEVGGRLHAAVVAADGVGLDLAALRLHCSQRLPVYAIPETIVPLAELPRTSTGKIDRLEVQRRLISGT